ncbi:uncharacterized protein L201_003410 [Kwoniella dendrophila CBS 6074]|uniref:RecF/RecN/SMC N-terminal domain-containing protein n=1 Tax=Kwoniella dendrophila CBS 6074 TaxID=1295534 RepID=A0AAX4JT46_9TREE
MVSRGSKRPAPAVQSDNEEGESSRAREIKRVKVKQERHLNGDNREEEEEEDGEDDDEDDSSSSDDSIPEVEEDGLNESDFDMDEEYEETVFKDEDLVRAFERSNARGKGYIGATSQSGILKSINLIDFMCHRHLSIDFCYKMNFLVGHNGSGKSAVLTAIAVALGGKAATTGRGQGLKDLIRKGADKSIITLVMANSGPEAFKPDVYGDQIVIERTISSNGSSGYKFKATRDGKTLFNKRSELTAISENYNINIDSPLTILTQDQARNFLSAADGKKLYKFFSVGTQLESLSETYHSAQETVQQIDVYTKRQVDEIPSIKEKIVNIERKIRASDAVLQQRNRYKRILEELAWSYVTDREKERDDCTRIVEENELKVETADNEVNKLEKKIIKLGDEIRNTERDITNFEENRKPMQKAVQSAKERVAKAKKDLGGLEEDIDAEKGGLSILQAKIDAKLRINADAQRSEHAKLVQDRTKFEELLNKFRKERPKRQQLFEEKQADCRMAKNQVQEVQYEIDQQQATAYNLQEKIKNLEGQSVNRLSAFGQGLDSIMKDIQRTQWKHSPPIGPLGMFVKLDDMYYRDIIQSILGQTLCSFAVRDNRDKATLIGILKRHLINGTYKPGTGTNQVPPVFLHHGDIFDFSRGDQSRMGPTFLSKLRVSDEAVLRLLITLHRIERTFLAKTVQEANYEMKRIHSNGLLDFVEYYSADFQNLRGTSTSKQSGPTGQWRGYQLFTRDLQHEVQRVREELQTCNTKMQEVVQTKAQAQQNVRNFEDELREINNDLQKVIKSIQPAEQKLDEIRRKLAEMSSTEMENWEADREDRMRKIEEKEGQLQAFLDDKAKQEENIRQYKQDILDRQKDLDDHAPQRQKQAEMMTKMVLQRTDLTKKKEHYARASGHYKERRDTAAAEAQDYENQVTEWTEKATGFCPVRVDSEKTSAQLFQERKTLEDSINDAERTLGIDTSQLASDRKKLKTRLQASIENINSIKKLIKIFCGAIVTRRRWWEETRSNIATRAKTAFVHFESLRGLDGRLAFDHKQEVLNLLVQSTTRTANADGEIVEKTHYKSAKTLSGGERSFSTVSFLLSLWSIAPSPIRALDEWDVFLDSANRKVAAKSLIDGASEAEKKQFILITPQDMAGIEISGPDKKLIRMADPNRNQSVF